jgi:hypothetical protein
VTCTGVAVEALLCFIDEPNMYHMHCHVAIYHLSNVKRDSVRPKYARLNSVQYHASIKPKNCREIRVTQVCQFNRSSHLIHHTAAAVSIASTTFPSIPTKASSAFQKQIIHIVRNMVREHGSFS